MLASFVCGGGIVLHCCIGTGFASCSAPAAYLSSSCTLALSLHLRLYLRPKALISVAGQMRHPDTAVYCHRQAAVQGHTFACVLPNNIKHSGHDLLHSSPAQDGANPEGLACIQTGAQQFSGFAGS